VLILLFLIQLLWKVDCNFINMHQQRGIHEAKYKQDRKCTYNVTLKRVRVTTVAVENKYILHILSVCL
jgi:hypothetical protein